MFNDYRRHPNVFRKARYKLYAPDFAKPVDSPAAEIEWLYQRTDWLGTINAVVDGVPEPPLRKWQAATININNANAAIRSICLGSCPP